MSNVTIIHPYTNFPMTFVVVAPVETGEQAPTLQEVEINWTPKGLAWRTVEEDEKGIGKTFPEPGPTNPGAGSPEGQPPA